MNAPVLPTVVAIVGPTAVGKTALAVKIAEEIACEVVSADSRQIYKGMDTGTAKPTPDEVALVKHHLLDVVYPDQVLALPQYIELATQAIANIGARGLLPLLVGGTGQYIRALLEGWMVPQVKANPQLRAELVAYAESQGPQALHQRLAAVDPLAAAKIDFRNVRRVVRALEVYQVSGQPISAVQTRREPQYRTLTIGLTLPRAELYRLADLRIDRMLATGFIEEVASLEKRGYALDLPAMSGLGYQQIGAYIHGEISLDEAILLIRRKTRQFIRHQYNWFRLSDPQIHWYQPGAESVARICAEIRAFLASSA